MVRALTLLNSDDPLTYSKVRDSGLLYITGLSTDLEVFIAMNVSMRLIFDIYALPDALLNAQQAQVLTYNIFNQTFLIAGGSPRNDPGAVPGIDMALIEQDDIIDFVSIIEKAEYVYRSQRYLDYHNLIFKKMQGLLPSIPAEFTHPGSIIYFEDESYPFPTNGRAIQAQMRIISHPLQSSQDPDLMQP